MWPIPAIEHKFVSILFSPDVLVCSWVDKTVKKSVPLILRAHQQYNLDNFELERLILFNPTVIKKYIISFLRQYNLTNAFVSFALSGPGMIEKLVIMHTSTPRYTDFGFPNNAGSVLCGYRYLYPYDHGQHMFYVYTIQRSSLLQYQLLAIAAACNLISITTKTMALFNAYKYIFGSAFRQSQLAVDMMRCSNNINNLITFNTLRRMMVVEENICPQECTYYATAAGLFVLQEMDR